MSYDDYPPSDPVRVRDVLIVAVIGIGLIVLAFVKFWRPT